MPAVIDSKTLLGGAPFEIGGMASHNEMTITTSCLVDTGANCYIIIDQDFARRLRLLTGAPQGTMTRCNLAGYDGQVAGVAEQVAYLTLDTGRAPLRTSPLRGGTTGIGGSDPRSTIPRRTLHRRLPSSKGPDLHHTRGRSAAGPTGDLDDDDLPVGPNGEASEEVPGPGPTGSTTTYYRAVYLTGGRPADPE